MLDAEEYFQLALRANGARDHHACMRRLDKVLEQQPRHAGALYLLAVQHAELGLIERSIDGLRAALAIEPGLESARLQLGMLLLQADRRTEAKEQFLQLEGSRDDGLQQYAAAMVALADNDVAQARKRLAAALTQRPVNPALSALMQRVLNGLATVVSPAAPADEISLGAYRQS